MRRLVLRHPKNIVNVFIGSNNNVAKFGATCQNSLPKIDKDTSDRNVHSLYIKWKTKAKHIYSDIQNEWRLTEFFKEGGKHAENHNIRPQQEYVIPKRLLYLIIFIFLLTIAVNMYPEDPLETNVYLKSLKDKQSSSANKDK